MEKQNLGLNNFLILLSDEQKYFLLEIDKFLSQNNYKPKVEPTKTMEKCTYISSKTRRAITSITLKNNNLAVHIYGDGINKYMDSALKMPNDMIAVMKKGTKCKKLENPTACNPKCIGGYDYYIDNIRYQKCRFMSFKYIYSKDNSEHIKKFIINECENRNGTTI